MASSGADGTGPFPPSRRMPHGTHAGSRWPALRAPRHLASPVGSDPRRGDGYRRHRARRAGRGACGRLTARRSDPLRCRLFPVHRCRVALSPQLSHRARRPPVSSSSTASAKHRSCRWIRRTSARRSLRAGCAFARSPRCWVSNTVPSRLMTPFWRVPIGTSSEVGHSACRSGPRRPRAPAGGPPAAGCLVAASLLAVTLSAANLGPQTTRVVIRLWARSTRCSKLAHRPPAGTPVRLGGPRRPSAPVTRARPLRIDRTGRSARWSRIGRRARFGAGHESRLGTTCWLQAWTRSGPIKRRSTWPGGGGRRSRRWSVRVRAVRRRSR